MRKPYSDQNVVNHDSASREGEESSVFRTGFFKQIQIEQREMHEARQRKAGSSLHLTAPYWLSRLEPFPEAAGRQGDRIDLTHPMAAQILCLVARGMPLRRAFQVMGLERHTLQRYRNEVLSGTGDRVGKDQKYAESKRAYLTAFFALAAEAEGIALERRVALYEEVTLDPKRRRERKTFVMKTRQVLGHDGEVVDLRDSTQVYTCTTEDWPPEALMRAHSVLEMLTEEPDEEGEPMESAGECTDAAGNGDRPDSVTGDGDELEQDGACTTPQGAPSPGLPACGGPKALQPGRGWRRCQQ